MKIKELMTRDVRVCQPGDNLSTAAQAMWEGDLGCLPVVDGNGQLVGMITDRDICMAAHLRGAPLWSVPVSDAMAKVVFTCQADHKVDAVLELIGDKRVRRVPVLDTEGKLAGLVTLTTLAQAVDSGAKAKAGVTAKDVCRTLCAVTAPRPATVDARMEVEVTRAKLPAKDTLTPAPRAAAGEKSSAKAAAKSASDKKPKKQRSGK
jgi:CBS domain-containing protein